MSDSCAAQIPIPYGIAMPPKYTAPQSGCYLCFPLQAEEKHTVSQTPLNLLLWHHY